MSAKRWYNYLVSIEPEGAAEAGIHSSRRSRMPEGRRNAAQTVAEIAAAATVEPKLAGRISASASFEEIYSAAEIRPPGHGYTILKVAEMLQSEHIRTLPADVKRSSVLVALEAAGVKIEEIIQDAVRRDRALDAFERVQQKALDELEVKKAEESRQIEAELDRLIANHRARIQANKDAVGKERERLREWRVRKQQEEERIAGAVSHFVTENPVTSGGAAGRPTPGPGPKA
jgi:hypothetical protein